MTRNQDRTVAYASCTEAGFEVLRNLRREGHRIDEIISLTPEQAESNAVSGYYSFDEFARIEDIDVYYPETYELETEADRRHFESLGADVLVVNGWQRLIPGDILSTVTHGALGVHGSAYGLPKGRGRSPMNWSLIEDLNRFLLSVIRLDEGVDSGDIVDTVKYDINDHDDIRTLYYKLVVATTDILDRTIEDIARGDFEFSEQTGDPTYYPKRTPEDGGIPWEAPTRKIYDLVRAVSRPYPGAFTEHDGTRILVWEAQPFSDDFRFDAEPGTIVQVFVTRDEFVVATADGSLLVTDWEADGWEPSEGMILRSVGMTDRVDLDHNHD